MRFDCGPTKPAKWAASQDWRPWFAWFPVRTGENDCRWLETVERRNTFHHIIAYSWEYRAQANV